VSAGPVDPAELAGMGRAQLLELCRARGLAATAWKKERMAQALATGEAPRARPARAGAPAGAAGIRDQLAARREAEGLDAAAAKARAKMEARTGRCLSASGCACEAWEAGMKDAHGWQLCECQHTQWTHAPAGQAPA